VYETQKVEGFRLPFPTLLKALGGITPELNQACRIPTFPLFGGKACGNLSAIHPVSSQILGVP
jgi:hypothetical protein